MNPPSQDPFAERFIACLLASFFALLGWFDLAQGGIHLKGKSGHILFVNGWVGIAVAGLAFLVAAFGVSILLNTFKAHRSTHYIGLALMLLPPIAFILFHH